MTKRKLTPEGQLKRLNDRVGGFVPREPIPPRPQAGWRQKVYIQTRTHGVFYTDDFVVDTDFIDGVPTWATVNVGLNLAFDGLGFRGDPFDPEYRQYALMEDGLYRREGGGNWVSVLTVAQAVAITGGDVNPLRNGFGPNGLNCNINREGWVGVLFWVTNLAGTMVKTVLLYSTDFGASWTEGIISNWAPTTIYLPFSLTVGAYKGSSPHGAGQVMYCGVTSNTWLAVSTDGGATWAWGANLGLAAYTCHILVDPSDQSRVFIGMRNGVGPWHVAVSLDHGATINDYDLNGSEPMGYGTWATYYHLSVAMDDHKTVRAGSQTGRVHIHTTRDDGARWEEPAPQYSANSLGISLIQDSPDFLYLLKQISAVAGPPPANCETVWASEDEGRTMVMKSGANACTIDTGGGDSIPYNCGGVRGILEIWTDLALGEVEGYPTDHVLGRHPGDLSWPQIDGMVGTGAEEVAAGSHAGQHENGGADEVNVAGLSGVLADEQDAGWLKGRTIGAGAPAEGEVYVWRGGPAEWQAEEAPGEEGKHVHVYKENLSALCDGARVQFFTANEFEEQTLRVLHQRDEEVDGVAEDYVEDALFNSFTMAVAPAGGDTLVAHYLATLI